jgi:hypothetical protein
MAKTTGGTVDVRRIYLDESNSILKNLPCPEARCTCEGRHTIVSATQHIASCLGAHGCNKLTNIDIPTIGVQEMSSFFQSPAPSRSLVWKVEEEVRNGRCLFIPLITCFKEWNNDFDWGDCRAKPASTWMKIMMVLMSDGDQTLTFHSLVIATGHKGDSSEEVEELLNQDLKQLSNPSSTCHSNMKGDMVFVCLNNTASTQQHPERSIVTFTMSLGSSHVDHHMASTATTRVWSQT